MKKNFAFLCLLSLLSQPVSPQAPDARQRALALTHVTVIDTTGGPAQPDETVVIRDGRIVGMGKSGKIRVPPDSEVVNATGKFLIPGLWDMNVFWYDPKEYLPLFIANGVTGVREVLGYAEHYQFRKEIERGKLLGPRWVIGTRWVAGPMPGDPISEAGAQILLANEEEARQEVANAQKYGADFIEIGGAENLPRSAFFALADEAKKRQIPFEGHVPVSVTLEEASNAGLKAIDTQPTVLDTAIMAAFSSHETDLLNSWQQGVTKAFASDQPDAFDPLWKGPGFRAPTQLALETYDNKKADRLFALLKANHTWMCATLAAQHNSAFFKDASVAGDTRFKYMSPGERSWYNEELSKTRSPEDSAVWKEFYKKYFELAGAMHRAGVEFLAGTTTEEPLFMIPGFSLHDELAELVKAGFTPMEALQTATANPARFLGKENDFGAIKIGKIADLVLLDADPLDDIGNTRKISGVVFSGTLYHRHALDAMIARVETLASRKCLSDVLNPTIKEKGAEAAVQQYRELKSTHRDAYDFDDKYELSSISRSLLREKKFDDAIRICELNLEEFPRSWWAYEDLAEAYQRAGKKELAAMNYKKSLELDPANQNAALKLKQLNAH